MIQAKELRIGNYVDYINKTHTVSIIRDRFINFKLSKPTREYKHSASVSVNHIKPIPLTEQWLVDFGFNEQLAFSLRTETDSFEVAHNDLDKWYCYFRNINKGEIDDFVQLRTNLKHVHQLQNLYFALTGKELTKQNTP